MKRTTHVCCAIVSAACMAPIACAGITVEHLSSDAEMENLIDEVAFEAAGRIGDHSLSGTFELGLGKSTSTPFDTRQYVWPQGQLVPFTLSYNGSLAVFAVTGTSPMLYPVSDDVTDLFIRTRAVDFGSQSEVLGLVLDDQPIAEASHALGPDGLDILHISGLNSSSEFNLNGMVLMDWEGTTPTQSELAFQIKAATTIPAPGAAAVLGLGLLGVRRRRRA